MKDAPGVLEAHLAAAPESQDQQQEREKQQQEKEGRKGKPMDAKEIKS
jgi:hypothetical protein